MLLRFGPFELDDCRFELRRNGEVLSVQPRVLETLLYLARHHGRLVTKDELVAGPWKGCHVTDAAITQAIKHARFALGDSAVARRTIETIRGKGFRFVQDVICVDDRQYDRTEPSQSLVNEGSASDEPAALVTDLAMASTAQALPFAGRRRELGQLDSAWAAARVGRGNAVLVHGIPGIGKTHLVERWAGEQSTLGAPVLWGHRWEGGDLLVPDWLERTGRAKGAPGADGQAGRLLNDADSGCLLRAASLQPLILVLEDMHVADSASLGAFERLCRSLGGSMLLLVCSFRTFEGKRLAPLASGIEGGLPNTRGLELRGLERDEVRELLELGARSDSISELADGVHGMTSGHPLLIDSLIRATSRERLERLRRVPVTRIPDRVGSAIRRSLVGVDPATLRILQAASVFGEHFSVPLLAELVREPALVVAERIDGAHRDRLIEEGSSRRLCFTHTLLRDVLYYDLPSVERLGLHFELGRLLAERSSMHPHWVADAAHHLLLAAPYGDPELAVDWARRAGDWSSRQQDHRRAAEYYQSALELLDSVGNCPSQRSDLLLRLARVQFLSGAVEAAQETYAEHSALGELHDLATRPHPWVPCRCGWGGSV